MILQMTPRAEFGLLAWLIENPARMLLEPFPSMLLLSKMHFREPRAQWLARYILLNNGDLTAISFDAEKYRQTWFRGFKAEAAKDGFAKCPTEIQEKLVRFAHPEFPTLTT